MKVFVTGGNGFIGSRVVRQLCEAGHQVRCLLRETSDTRRIDDLDFERFYGDVRNADSLAEGMRGMDGCIHLASISAWSQMNSSVLEETILDGTRNVLDAAEKAGNVRIVYASSVIAVNASDEPKVFDEDAPFELGDTALRYAKAKHGAEKLIADYVQRGLDVVIVNPAEVYGTDDDAMVTAGNIRDFMRDWPCLACDGGTAVTYVDDVADGMIKALEKGRSGERYILGGDNLTVEQLARLTLDIAGQRKPILKLPNGFLKWSIGTLDKLGLPTPVEPGVLDYATRYFFMDSSKAKQELGYQPRSARECLAPVVDWLRSAGHV